MYQNINTSTQFSESDIRSLFLNTSFPIPFVPPTGFEYIFPTPQPTFDNITQRLVETTPVLTDKGHWEQRWAIDELFDLQADKDAEIANNMLSIKKLISERIKIERDRRRFDGGVKVGTNWFLSSAIAQNEYNSMLLLYINSPITQVIRANWRTMSKNETDMTVGLVKQILVAGLTTFVSLDDAAKTHINALFASTDPQNYDFSSGWPEMFIAI